MNSRALLLALPVAGALGFLLGSLVAPVLLSGATDRLDGTAPVTRNVSRDTTTRRTLSNRSLTRRP